MLQGKFDDAIDAVVQAMRLAPTVSDFYITAGIIFCHVRNYPDALHAFFRAAERNPSDNLAWYNLGVLVRPEHIIIPSTPPFSS
jgi:tetratricopeptide (TPR) repeat protein